MTYFSLSDYNDYYVIPFVDIDGNEWKITIQSPNGDTPMDPIQLVGAANPIEWMGVGDEDQTNVVLGSTGTLRLVCTDATKNEFVQGALFPEAINERKVIVTRKTNNTDVLIWQGFIKPEQYTQDWDRPPYEIELPIISPIAATEFFPMPDYNSVLEKTTIAGLLQYALDLLGCEFIRIITNKPVYEDFNGNTQEVTVDNSTAPMHWTEGSASSLFFYNFEGDGIKPKTLKDLLEAICYPYGKINDCKNFITILMAAGKYIDEDAELFVLTSGTRFNALGDLNEFDLSDLQIASTDNSTTLISKPSSVSFVNSVETEQDIFEITEKYLKSSLPCTVTDISDTNKVKVIHQDDWYRYHYKFGAEYVNESLYTPVNAYNLPSVPAFMRVVDQESEDDGATWQYKLVMPLAFRLSADNSVFGNAFGFDIPMKIKSTPGKNKVKVSFNVYADSNEPELPNGIINRDALLPLIIDVDSGKYIRLTDKQWYEMPNTYTDQNIHWATMEYLTNQSITFNEPRNTGDILPHTLRFVMRNSSLVASTASTHNFYFKVKVEYVRDDARTMQLVADTFADTLINAGQDNDIGGSGPAINIDLKTMCGRSSIIINGNAFAPYNSFCDATKYIDTGNRKKIELEAVKFTTDFIDKPFLVNDGSTVYFPVAFGMNPRNNTVNLRLISTNIGITQPTQS